MFSHERFSELMQKNGVTNYKLAKFLGCSQSSVKNWLTKTEPNAEYISKIAQYFDVSANFILGLEDEYGLTDFDWRMMGTAYSAYRQTHNVSLDSAVDGEVVTVDQLKAFEESGRPLALNQLDVICGLAGSNAPYVFAVWSDNLYGQKEKPAGMTDEQLKFALWGDTKNITDDDLEDVRRFAAFIKQKREQEGTK